MTKQTDNHALADQTLLNAILTQTETLGRVAQISGDTRDAIGRLIEQQAALDKSVTSFGYNLTQLQKDFDDLKHELSSCVESLESSNRKTERLFFDMYGDSKNDGIIDTVKKLKHAQDARTTVLNLVSVFWGIAGTSVIAFLMWAASVWVRAQTHINTLN